MELVKQKQRGDIKAFKQVSWSDIEATEVGNDLVIDEGLENYILISVFTDKRDSDVENSGWWGDSILETEVGSKVYLLSRRNITTSLIADYEKAIRDSLQWMVDEGIISSVECIVRRHETKKSWLLFNIRVTRNGNSVPYQYYYNWENQLVKKVI